MTKLRFMDKVRVTKGFYRDLQGVTIKHSIEQVGFNCTNISYLVRLISVDPIEEVWFEEDFLQKL